MRAAGLGAAAGIAGRMGFSMNSEAGSCDTWVALPDATADGSVILAKNSDRPPMEAQPLVYRNREKYGARW
jgi:hypothetical protein